MPGKRRFFVKRDPPHIIQENCVAGRAARREIYGDPDLALDSKKQGQAWGFLTCNFVTRRPLFKWDEFREAVTRYVHERGGPEKYVNEIEDFNVLKRFRAHLWARVKAEGRSEKAIHLIHNPVGLDGSVRTAVRAAQYAEERAAKA